LDSAIRYSERAVQLAPGEMQWRRTLGSLYALAGRYEEGVRECAAGVGPENTCRVTLGLVANVPGMREAGLARLGALGDAPRALRSPMWAALVYARLGMKDSMFSRLSNAVANHDDAFTHLIAHAAFTKYQSDPRWDAIVGEVRRR
jgi:hypothetical protein